MKVYWLKGKKRKQVLYHLVPNEEIAHIIIAGLRQCGIKDIWIETICAHKRYGY